MEGEELEERGDLETLAGAPEEARRGARGDRDGDAAADGDALDQKGCEPVGRVGAARRARRLARALRNVPYQRRGDDLDPREEEELEHDELEVAVDRVEACARFGAPLFSISFPGVVQ